MSKYFEPAVREPFEPAAIAAACIESGSRSLLLDEDRLPAEFFDLSTRVAGELLHRLTTYGIRLAGVVGDSSVHSAAFKDFMTETNRGRQARFFPTRDEAIRWLLNDEFSPG